MALDICRMKGIYLYEFVYSSKIYNLINIPMTHHNACYRVGTHLENREIREKSGGNIFVGKVREIHENLSKSGKNEIVLTNDLENLDTAILLPYFVKG